MDQSKKQALKNFQTTKFLMENFPQPSMSINVIGFHGRLSLYWITTDDLTIKGLDKSGSWIVAIKLLSNNYCR
jgi:hypothetical protein